MMNHTPDELEVFFDLYDLLEDTSSFACQEYGVSASLVYLAMEAFVESKRSSLDYLKKTLDDCDS